MSGKFFTRFVLVWFINSLLLYLADIYGSAIFSLKVTDISSFWTAAITGFFLTLICKLSNPLLKYFGFKLKGRFGMFIFYWVVNSLFIWMVAMITHFITFNINSIYWALTLGVVMDIMQWFMRQIFKSLNLMRS